MEREADRTFLADCKGGINRRQKKRQLGTCPPGDITCIVKEPNVPAVAAVVVTPSALLREAQMLPASQVFGHQHVKRRRSFPIQNIPVPSYSPPTPGPKQGMHNKEEESGMCCVDPGYAARRGMASTKHTALVDFHVDKRPQINRQPNFHKFLSFHAIKQTSPIRHGTTGTREYLAQGIHLMLKSPFVSRRESAGS